MFLGYNQREMEMVVRNTVLNSNCLAHSKSLNVLTNARVVFLPPNLTSDWLLWMLG